MIVTAELVETARYVLGAFQAAGQTIATAESCTGGLVAALLTDIPGSSAVFERGFVTYSNAAKSQLLGVDPETIAEHGAVSRETALAMARGALDHSAASVSVAITGIAGPDGGSEEKPVGLVFVAIAGPMGLFVEELRLGSVGREVVRQQSAQVALEMLVAFGLEDDPGDDSDPAILN
ncbi:MAG: CinA family protein [Nitratireductor sp.]|nr:CinA family protein [Nitratireductor sp.]